jgi:hypothetical protein
MWCVKHMFNLIVAESRWLSNSVDLVLVLARVRVCVLTQQPMVYVASAAIRSPQFSCCSGACAGALYAICMLPATGRRPCSLAARCRLACWLLACCMRTITFRASCVGWPAAGCPVAGAGVAITMYIFVTALGCSTGYRVRRVKTPRSCAGPCAGPALVLFKKLRTAHRKARR